MLIIHIKIMYSKQDNNKYKIIQIQCEKHKIPWIIIIIILEILIERNLFGIHIINEICRYPQRVTIFNMNNNDSIKFLNYSPKPFNIYTCIDNNIAPFLS